MGVCRRPEFDSRVEVHGGIERRIAIDRPCDRNAGIDRLAAVVDCAGFDQMPQRRRQHATVNAQRAVIAQSRQDRRWQAADPYLYTRSVCDKWCNMRGNAPLDLAGARVDRVRKRICDFDAAGDPQIGGPWRSKHNRCLSVDLGQDAPCASGCRQRVAVGSTEMQLAIRRTGEADKHDVNTLLARGEAVRASRIVHR